MALTIRPNEIQQRNIDNLLETTEFNTASKLIFHVLSVHQKNLDKISRLESRLEKSKSKLHDLERVTDNLDDALQDFFKRKS